MAWVDCRRWLKTWDQIIYSKAPLTTFTPQNLQLQSWHGLRLGFWKLIFLPHSTQNCQTGSNNLSPLTPFILSILLQKPGFLQISSFQNLNDLHRTYFSDVEESPVVYVYFYIVCKVKQCLLCRPLSVLKPIPVHRYCTSGIIQ